jgi:hypothetical protein
MSRQRREPMDYANADLMDDLNKFMIAVKTHLFHLPVNCRKPTIQEMDVLQDSINHELMKDAKPLRKY